MFYYVKGEVAKILPNLAVIDCGGVGYACHTTNNTLSYLKPGTQATLYTYLHVKEDVFELYGFQNESELNFFKLLLGVSGVGPKAALSILSSNSPENLALSIASGDEKTITAAPGIGKKIAQRVILELKEKIAGDFATSANEGFSGSTNTVIPQNKSSEATAALAVLGYSVQEINIALKGINMEELSLQEIIRAALKKMAKG